MTQSVRVPYVGRPQPLRWSGEAFDRAVASGLFDGQRVELIDGELLEEPPINDPHAQSITLTDYALRQIFSPDAITIRVQCPMRLGESRPLPDLAVVIGTPRQIATHPTSAMLVVEISDSSLEFDQTEKAALYAAHMIPEYWIINLKSHCVEVRRKPIRKGNSKPRYQSMKLFHADETVSPLAASQVFIKVSELLP